MSVSARYKHFSMLIWVFRFLSNRKSLLVNESQPNCIFLYTVEYSLLSHCKFKLAAQKYHLIVEQTLKGNQGHLHVNIPWLSSWGTPQKISEISVPWLFTVNFDDFNLPFNCSFQLTWTVWQRINHGDSSLSSERECEWICA